MGGRQLARVDLCARARACGRAHAAHVCLAHLYLLFEEPNSKFFCTQKVIIFSQCAWRCKRHFPAVVIVPFGRLVAFALLGLLLLVFVFPLLAVFLLPFFPALVCANILRSGIAQL